MYTQVGGESVHFIYDSEQVGQMLDLLFVGWPWNSARPTAHKDISRDANYGGLNLQLVVVNSCRPVTARLVFYDHRSQTSVRESERYWYICFGNNAVARVSKHLSSTADVPIRVELTSNALLAGQLEDIVFSSLAPILRSRGLFLIHAFAAAKDDDAVLIVGESGSGKTTTGLTLTSNGWRYLGNDVAIIREESGGVNAWPTPGGIGLDSESYTLLSKLPGAPAEGDHRGKHYLPAARFVEGWALSATPIRRIFFPIIEEVAEISLRPVPASVTLARLMEASIDRWDSQNLQTHMRILKLLSGQAQGYDLRLNRKLDQLPTILDQRSLKA